MAREYTVDVECVRIEHRNFVTRADSPQEAVEKAKVAAQARGYEVRDAEVKDERLT